MPPPALVRRLLLSVLLAGFFAPLTRAQPLFDGATLGIGLTNYHGDLDWNQDRGRRRGTMGHLAAGNLTAFLGVDRAFGPVTGEAILSYTDLNVDFPQVEASLRTVSLDLTAGYTFDIIRPAFIRFYAGIAPLVVVPRYDRVDQDVLDNSILTFEEQDTKLFLSFPVGIVIQDALRFGVRIMPTDNFDGARGPSGLSDFLSLIQVGYRFDLLD